MLDPVQKWRLKQKKFKPGEYYVNVLSWMTSPVEEVRVLLNSSDFFFQTQSKKNKHAFLGQIKYGTKLPQTLQKVKSTLDECLVTMSRHKRFTSDNQLSFCEDLIS